MYSIWRNSIKTKYLDYYDTIREKYIKLKELAIKALQVDLKTMVDRLTLSPAEKEKVKAKTIIITQ
jgi:hypothetical protein